QFHVCCLPCRRLVRRIGIFVSVNKQESGTSKSVTGGGQASQQQGAISPDHHWEPPFRKGETYRLPHTLRHGDERLLGNDARGGAAFRAGCCDDNVCVVLHIIDT